MKHGQQVIRATQSSEVLIMPITDPEKVHSIAFKMITRRPLTVSELIDRLRRKGVTLELAETIVAEFNQKGYIDENAITEDHIRYCKEYKLCGKFMLRHELKRRGLDSQVIEKNLELLYPDSDEIVIARKLVIRKLRALTGLPLEVRERRLGGALQRRGFPSEIIVTVIREIKQ
ncbi:MAG: regulatory protein RecX [Calditrichaeota bacterium]|nr:regulatory protein RecX [Calditrichota bacterium]